MTGSPREFRCSWCQATKPHGAAPCPAACDRRPGFSLKDKVGRGPGWKRSRMIVLTPLGWQAAGYVPVDGGWRKAP